MYIHTSKVFDGKGKKERKKERKKEWNDTK